MASNNAEPPKQPNALARMFDISSRVGCESAMRNGAICLFLGAALLGWFVLMAYWGDPIGHTEFDARIQAMRSPQQLINVVVYAVLGVFVYRRSRLAATCAVLYWVALVIWQSLELGRLSLNIVSAFILALLVVAMAASYQWHRLYAAEAAHGTPALQTASGSSMGGDPSAASTSEFIAILRFVFGVLVAFFVAGTAASMWMLVKEPGMRSVVSLLLSALTLYAAISTYRALKLGAIKAIRFALLFFVLGYLGTAAYRLGFVPGGEGPQVSDLLLFGIPAALVLIRAWQESRTTAPR